MPQRFVWLETSYLQSTLKGIENILIYGHSMLGQTTFSWNDRRCIQSIELKKQLFQDKQVILIEDDAQLPSVDDKPLYHAILSNAVGEQGCYAYR